MCDNKWRFNLRVSPFFPSFREVCVWIFFFALVKKAQEGGENFLIENFWCEPLILAKKKTDDDVSKKSSLGIPTWEQKQLKERHKKKNLKTKE